MKRTELIEYHYKAIEILEEIEVLNEKIKSIEESINGIGGSFLQNKFIWKEEIIILKNKINKLTETYKNL